MEKRILFVVNSPAFFISHRLALAIAAKKDGYDVHVATMPSKDVGAITSFGFAHHELPLTRSGRSLLSEIYTFYMIVKLFRLLRPKLVHLVTIKPVLYGGIAARLLKVPGVVVAVSGLGFVFIAKGIKASIIRLAVMNLYRMVFGKKNLCVIFQNPDDRSKFILPGILAINKTVIIKGSGVNLDEYPVTAEPKGIPVVIMAARLLRDKGVNEFAAAARILVKRSIWAKFRLVGDIDEGNPASVTESELEIIRREGAVDVLGFRNDIPSLLFSSHIVVLPSYREGLPKALMEAAAAGRPVITTDVPGCRDAIEPNETGLLVPVRDTHSLANAIQKLIDDPDLRQKMGLSGRLLAENEFSIEKNVSAHLKIYRMLELLHDSK
jgi:glycosyltransferase involved in cell wall biosynthesis